MNLKALQNYVQDLTEQQGWGNETIQTRLHYLKSEIIEATQEITAMESATTEEELQQHKENLGLELFDIFWNAAEIANRYGIDLTSAAEKKIEINSNRIFSAKPKEVRMISAEEGKVHEETTV